MKLLVGIDSDAHFFASHPSDRYDTLESIKKIDFGDYFYGIVCDYELEIKKDLSEYCCQEWDELLSHFIERGRLEYVEVSDIIPIACICQ